MAAGVKALREPAVRRRARVGIFGTSYGGYTSAMELLRHPDVFAAASASSPPTDWRTTTRSTPSATCGFRRRTRPATTPGSAMTYAKDLKGRLLLYYGTADNNVHPSNIAAADSGAAGRRQELRPAGRPGPRPQRHEPRSHDGVLHRGAEASRPAYATCSIRVSRHPRTAARVALRRDQGRAPRCRFRSPNGCSTSSITTMLPPSRRCATCTMRPRRQPARRAGAGLASRLPAPGDDHAPHRAAAAAARHSAGHPDPVAARTVVDGQLLLSPSSLPPGIRLERDRVLVDVRQLLELKGFGEVVPLIERLHVASEEGRLDVEMKVRGFRLRGKAGRSSFLTLLDEFVRTRGRTDPTSRHRPSSLRLDLTRRVHIAAAQTSTSSRHRIGDDQLR